MRTHNTMGTRRHIGRISVFRGGTQCGTLRFWQRRTDTVYIFFTPRNCRDVLSRRSRKGEHFPAVSLLIYTRTVSVEFSFFPPPRYCRFQSSFL